MEKNIMDGWNFHGQQGMNLSNIRMNEWMIRAPIITKNDCPLRGQKGTKWQLQLVRAETCKKNNYRGKFDRTVYWSQLANVIRLTNKRGFNTKKTKQTEELRRPNINRLYVIESVKKDTIFLEKIFQNFSQTHGRR